MKTLGSNGVRIVYDDVGEGFPIFLLHGFQLTTAGMAAVTSRSGPKPTTPG
jgi:hypothetical protein